MTNRTLRSASSSNDLPTQDPPSQEPEHEDQDMPDAAVNAPEQSTNQDTTQNTGNSQETPVSNAPPQTMHPQVDAILVLLNQHVEETARDLLKAQGKSKEEHDKAIQKHTQAQEACAAYLHTQRTLNSSSRKEDQIVPPNMPMLQIKGGPLRDQNKTVHESVQAFFSAFEAQLRSRSLNLDRHWERLIWTTLDSQQNNWATKRLAGHHLTWEQAKIEIQRMYGNPLYTYRKQFELSRKFQNQDNP